MTDENKATNLNDFESQLKATLANTPNPPEKPLALSDFENQLKQNLDQNKGINPMVGPMQQNMGNVNPNTKMIKVQKNIVLSFPSDFTGCGHIRNIFPMSFLSNLYGKSGQLICMIAPFYIRQIDVLAKSRTLFFQRQMNQPQYEIVKNYKNIQKDLKFKMVWDMDDMIWGKNEWQGGSKKTGVPTYNFGHRNIDDGVRKW